VLISKQYLFIWIVTLDLSVLAIQATAVSVMKPDDPFQSESQYVLTLVLDQQEYLDDVMHGHALGFYFLNIHIQDFAEVEVPADQVGHACERKANDAVEEPDIDNALDDLAINASY